MKALQEGTPERAAEARERRRHLLLLLPALEVDPTIAAVSSFLIGVTTAILGASALLRRRGEGS
jgi:hypothetical protein